MPVFTDDFVYIPRRVVVAVATRPVGEPVHPDGDLGLIRTIRSLFGRTPADIAAQAALPDESYRYWFDEEDRWWGVSPAERADWLAWAEKRQPVREEDA